MFLGQESAGDVYTRTLARLLACVAAASVWDEPFSHTYFENCFPADLYAALLSHLPPAAQYSTGPRAPNARPCVRSFYNLTTAGIRRLPVGGRQLWCGVSAALTDPQLKRTLFAQLAPDLVRRYGVRPARVADLAGHPRPTLYRDVEGYELPPHPDTLKKVVTMHLYLPSDLSQIDLGTALYTLAPAGDADDPPHTSFTLLKQFEFRPNSGYAFVVSNSVSRQSWHGRTRLPVGAGSRNTLLNTFYGEPRHGYSGYLEEDEQL